MREESARVDRAERMVTHIAVPVPRLTRLTVLSHRISRQEPPDVGVIDAPVHVNQRNVIQLLMEREAPSCCLRDRGPVVGARASGGPIARPPLAEGTRTLEH